MTERRRWFLPEVPDVQGLLRAQVAITREGAEAFEGWCRGESGAADRVRDAEGRGDAAKRAVLTALRGAFVTELEPEDLFSLSRGIDRILNSEMPAISSMSTTGGWPRCSSSTTGASGSHGASSIAAASASGRP